MTLDLLCSVRALSSIERANQGAAAPRGGAPGQDAPSACAKQRRPASSRPIKVRWYYQFSVVEPSRPVRCFFCACCSKGVERGWDVRRPQPVTPPPRPKEAACGLGAACKPAGNGRLRAVPKRRTNRARARIAAHAGATTTARPQPVGRVGAGRSPRSPCHSHARTEPCARAARPAR